MRERQIDFPQHPFDSKNITSGDGVHADVLYTAREITQAFPKKYIVNLLAAWLLVAVLMACVDLAIMNRIANSLHSDAFGNSTVDRLVIFFATALSLALFLAISFLWAMTEKRKFFRAVAVLVSMLLVLFFAFSLWSTEVATLRSVWFSATTSSLATAEEQTSPPFWFLAAGVGIVSIIYTVPGLAFGYAKSRVYHMRELLRAYAQVDTILTYGQEVSQVREKARLCFGTAAHFQSDEACSAVASSLVREGVQEYFEVIHGQNRRVQEQLASGVALQPHERQRKERALREGRNLLSECRRSGYLEENHAHTISDEVGHDNGGRRAVDAAPSAIGNDEGNFGDRPGLSVASR
jgi:hypothetical protein